MLNLKPFALLEKGKRLVDIRRIYESDAGPYLSTLLKLQKEVNEREDEFVDCKDEVLTLKESKIVLYTL